MASKKRKMLLKVKYNGKMLPMQNWSIIDLTKYGKLKVDATRHLIDENGDYIVCLDDLYPYKEITPDQIIFFNYILSLCSKNTQSTT